MNWNKMIAATTLLGLLGAFVSVGVAAQSAEKMKATTTLTSKELASACAMLDNPKKRPLMDALENKLLVLCDRTHEFGGVESERYDADHNTNKVPGTDTQVNDDTGETGLSQTQNETSIARNEVTGTLCSGFNDSWSGVGTGDGFTGFSRSVDDGASFSDGGAFDSNSFGDPSMIWRRSDGNFYLGTLHSNGLGIYRSTDDCQTFQFLALGHSGGSDDKELLAIDNNVGSSFYGRMHMVWTDFTDARIYATHSDNGTSWSTPVAISASATDVQGAWPIVADDGTVYVAWIRWNPYFNGPIDIEVVRSTNGGVSYTSAANPLTGAVNPYAAGPTSSCGRPALNGNIRYLPSPQIAVTPNGDLHATYSYDPDGRDVGDAIDVFYRRSTDQGASWLPEVKLNDDATLTDQFFPSISAGPSGRIVVAWYDRRLDSNNLFVDYYAVMSEDGGASFGPNERISDESSPIYIDPGLAGCYHGDYDQQLQTASSAFLQWADDRKINSGHNDPNVYVDQNTFEPDFFLSTQNSIQEVCAPANANYDIDVNQSLGFTDPVTLTVAGEPAGTVASFSVNPVVPDGTSTLTISNTAGGAAGSYILDVTGTAAMKSRAAQLQLTLATAIPGTSSLLAPANGATDQSTSPLFSWAAASQASSYTIEIASDANFTNVIESDTVSDTSYQATTSLGPNTQYFWRVTANNICGTGSLSAASSFETQNIICVSPGVSIPDNAPAGVDSATFLASGGILTDLNVSIQATHTYVGDLAFTVTHVDTGTSALIIDRPGRVDSGFGCSSNDIDAILDDDAAQAVEDECSGSGVAIDGTFSPNNPLSVFNGEDLAGTWEMTATDNAGSDLGTLDEWCLLPALEQTVVDSDGDGVTDDLDNCTDDINPTQLDSNGDGFGNQCDPDTNNDCIVNFLDVGEFSNNFLGSDPDFDFNGDGNVNFLDYPILTTRIFGQPGPSALANCSIQ